ncbi:transposase [Actinocorallia sp. API 0066]|uniref:transposase n=1 Tax=Actinocorallia sp. API 0066 TaxID=2896846 RepID=UPI0035ABF741
MFDGDVRGRLHDRPGPPAFGGRPAKGGPCRGTIGQDDHGRTLSRQGIGRSRGGLTSKTHLVVEGRGLPMAVLVTGGNVNDSTVFETLMARIRVRRPDGGRPRTRPSALPADKGYAARRILAYR